nr:MAG TPA: hypothetical protein [Caudoviricetes sp.]
MKSARGCIFAISFLFYRFYSRAKIVNAEEMKGTKKASLRLLQSQRGFKNVIPIF